MSSHKTEDRIQQECFMWFWNTYPQYRKLLFAVPNGGARSSQEGKLLKKTGVVAGVSDMILLINAKAYCFELKTVIGVQSKKQKDWEYKVKNQGFNYYLVRNKDDFEYIIKNIIKENEK